MTFTNIDAVLAQGRAAFAEGDLDTAATLFDQACRDAPRAFEPRYWLASVLIAAGATDAARSLLADACTLHGVSVIQGLGVDMARFQSDKAHAAEIGRQLYAARLMGPASVAFSRALDVDNLDPNLLLHYGLSLQHQGRVDEAVDVFTAGAEDSDNAAIAEFQLFCLFFVDDGVRRYAEAARVWAQKHTSGLAPARPGFANATLSGRRLRVGYVAPGFTKSQLNQFLTPVLEAHDPAAVEVFLYCADPDAEATLPQHMHRRRIGGVADEAVAAQVRADRIDVLVDLWGHTAGSRLRMFAMRPAPVQLAWINFVQTTGVEAIDYVLHADSTDAPGTEELFTEEIWRIGEVFAPFRPLPGRPPPAPTPALANGRITFGSFNNPMKLSDQTVEAWARVLEGRPGSVLVLKYGVFADPVLQRMTQARFAAFGVAPEQLEFRGHSTGADYLREFEDIDLALDPSPCPGGTTTCDAIAAGVPILTLRGPDFYSRIGVTVAIACATPELIAEDWDDYVARAIALTEDVQALDALRIRTREGFEAGAFRDEIGFTRRLEGDLRQMFERWQAKARAAA